MSVRLGYLIASGISKGGNHSAAQWHVLSVNVPFVIQLNLECAICAIRKLHASIRATSWPRGSESRRKQQRGEKF